MSDWKLDDKEWVKARKKAWPEYKFNIEKSGMSGWINVDKLQHKNAEKYFLSGNRDALVQLYTHFNDSLLLELWIHPSAEFSTLKDVFFRHLKEKPEFTRSPTISIYRTRDINFFRPLCFYEANIKFKGSSRLNGRDRLIDAVFMPQTLSEELVLANKDEHYTIARNHFLGGCTQFEDFFARDNNLDVDICQIKVAYWKDALMMGVDSVDNFKAFEWMLEELDKVVLSPENYQPCQLRLASEIEAVLSEHTIPEVLKTQISKLRQLEEL
ncbi:MAG: hypothetical protein HRU23_20345 [Gammaproteobacteria bacterium]|nr:hypothetical protein [Gammaproteobacteria bacterium]